MTEEDFITWIKQQISYYSPILGLELISISIEKTDKYYMAMKSNYPYVDPTLYYKNEAYKDWTDGKLLKDRILHEMVHVVTDPLFCKAGRRFISESELDDERERLTDTIAAIIRRIDNKIPGDKPVAL